MIILTHQLIDLDFIDQYTKPLEKCGGHVWFIGTVRSPNKGIKITKLFFEAYETMAKKELEKIYNESKIKFNLKNLLIIHRLGEVFTSENVVVVVASSLHRKEAFLGCEYVIDELKNRVPIWKKEYSYDQFNWVNSSNTP